MCAFVDIRQLMYLTICTTIIGMRPLAYALTCRRYKRWNGIRCTLNSEGGTISNCFRHFELLCFSTRSAALGGMAAGTVESSIWKRGVSQVRSRCATLITSLTQSRKTPSGQCSQKWKMALARTKRYSPKSLREARLSSFI